MDIRIYYEDTDCGGVVYYSNYLKFFERARTELLRGNGVDVGGLAGKGLLFVVARAEVDYRYPAVYNDLIHIETEIVSLKAASFDLRYEVTRKSDSKPLASGVTRMAAVDKRRKPVKISGPLRETLSGMLKKND